MSATCLGRGIGCDRDLDFAAPGEPAAVMLTLIHTAKLNNVDPQAWLADVLACINDHNIHRLDDLLPWNWAAETERNKVAA